MKKPLITLIFFGLASFINGQKSDSITVLKNFKDKLEKCNLKFVQPVNFKEIAIKENEDQYYEYAIRHNDLKLEIRYYIRPYDSLTIELYQAAPQMVQGMFITTIMNMTHGKRNDFNEFPLKAVKKEFGADWGATATVELNCEFGKGFKYCTLTTIHKDNNGDVFIFYLYDDIEEITRQMNDLTNNWFTL